MMNSTKAHKSYTVASTVSQKPTILNQPVDKKHTTNYNNNNINTALGQQGWFQKKKKIQINIQLFK